MFKALTWEDIYCLILTAIVSALIFKLIEQYKKKTLEWQRKFIVGKRINDENSGSVTYWMVTATSVFIYVFLTSETLTFFHLSSGLIGVIIGLLVVSGLIYFFRRNDFPKTLCYTTVPLMIWHFFNLFY